MHQFIPRLPTQESLKVLEQRCQEECAGRWDTEGPHITKAKQGHTQVICNTTLNNNLKKLSLFEK